MRKSALIFGISGQDGSYLAQLLMSKCYFRFFFGEFIDRFESEFGEFCDSKYAVSCSNRTTALLLAAINNGAGDYQTVFSI